MQHRKAVLFLLNFPEHLKLRKAGKMAHYKGIFLSTVEEPTVPGGTERFRISIMAKSYRRRYL
jgi:7-keto-8-aminopelargonate synthetase-like enzyme